jgi:hypothetical protein
MKIFFLCAGVFFSVLTVGCNQPAQQPQEVKTTLIKDTIIPENQSLKHWKVYETVTMKDIEKFGFEKCFCIEEISDKIFSRMKGKSFADNCTLKREDLRYLKLLHYDLNGDIRLGEMVCNKAIAEDLINIFHELFVKKYPIEKIRLIDDYDADDEKSMSDNNTSCFCFRNVSGSNSLSLHALGKAVDINTRYNPYIRTFRGKTVIQPANGEPYCDRSKDFDYKITAEDDCCKIFKKYGFLWGGEWGAYKDYQHFYKK